MFNNNKENGYALIIVLFVVVFITILTAVFMRGALSNFAQEKTVDENNLVVVSAESGIEYYTWELKTIYDKNELERAFNKEVNKAIAQKESPDYTEIRKGIVDEFRKKLKIKMKEMSPNKTNSSVLSKEMFNRYNHKLIYLDCIEDTSGNANLFTINGTVEGELPSSANTDRKVKNLDFVLSFNFPPLSSPNGNSPDTRPPSGNIVSMPTLKNPEKPASPVAVVKMGRPTSICKTTNNIIVNQQCNTSGINASGHTIEMSSVFVGETLNSWGVVTLKNAIINIRKNFTPAKIEILGTELLIGGEIGAYQSPSNVIKSIISTNSYNTSGQVNFTETDLTVVTNYSSGGVSFKDSTIDVAGKLDTGGGLFYVEGSNVKITGNANTHNGSTIKDATLEIGGNFVHTSKPLDATNSDVFVRGKVTSTNATNLEKVNMKVLGGYESNGVFKLAKTNLSIVGNLNLTNGGTLNNSLLVANSITITTPFILNGSIVSADYIKTTNNMTINNSEICVNNFISNGLTMDSNSKVYYKSTSNHESKFNDRFLKLSDTDFASKCGVAGQVDPTDPQNPGEVNWVPTIPVLEKVTY
ncbi:hypothetical protein [Sporosarcina sp. P17b]|uniref:hypothetical protein n=1 Tax=Sporosarcina sp. P17b TaxID=2048260 RepID=UPI000C17004E|nr:hypothetical protein [Sporosarcina sp. P17b]PIC72781.1 hypothetical protein CSV76_13150 [Sporosarcina sp. P17b]